MAHQSRPRGLVLLVLLLVVKAWAPRGASPRARRDAGAARARPRPRLGPLRSAPLDGPLRSTPLDGPLRSAPEAAPPLRSTSQEVEEARDADIVQVAEYLGLDVDGRTNKCLCPFHDERTPSFVLNRDRGLYKCFGCGAGGDAIALYRNLRPNATFPDAVAALRSLRPGRMPAAAAPVASVTQDPDAIRAACAAAARFYRSALAFDESCGGARQYLWAARAERNTTSRRRRAETRTVL